MPASQPPVFFTLVVVRHEPLAKLDKYLPDVQDALRRKGFSGQMVKIEQRLQTQANLAAPPTNSAADILETHYRIFTADQRSAFTFNDHGSFSYATTAYTDRAALFNQVHMGLKLFNGIVQIQQFYRVGIRMLDLIRPSDTKHELSEMVQPSLLGFRGIEFSQTGNPTISSMEQAFIGEAWEARARLDCLPDVFGLNSNLLIDIQGFQFPEQVVRPNRGLHGILDIDSGTRSTLDNVHAFDLERVMAELTEHKNRISELFRSSVTLTALKAWGLA